MVQISLGSLHSFGEPGYKKYTWDIHLGANGWGQKRKLPFILSSVSRSCDHLFDHEVQAYPTPLRLQFLFTTKLFLDWNTHIEQNHLEPLIIMPRARQVQPLPEWIRDDFSAIPMTSVDENLYYSAINALLNEYFPRPFYRIYPQARPVAGPTRQSIDFLVTHNDLPLFFIEAKARGRLGLRAAREDADGQMRLRLAQLWDACPATTLFGVSLFGNRMCLYSSRGPTYSSPKANTQSNRYVTDVSPISRYSTDITTLDGSREMVRVFGRVRQMAGH